MFPPNAAEHSGSSAGRTRTAQEHSESSYSSLRVIGFATRYHFGGTMRRDSRITGKRKGSACGRRYRWPGACHGGVSCFASQAVQMAQIVFVVRCPSPMTEVTKVLPLDRYNKGDGFVPLKRNASCTILAGKAICSSVTLRCDESERRSACTCPRARSSIELARVSTSHYARLQRSSASSPYVRRGRALMTRAAEALFT